MSPARTILRTATVFGQVALVAGGIQAARVIGARTWVLEFQAGPASTWLEKLGAILQSAGIEGWGFLAVGLFLAACSAGLARVHPCLRDDEVGSGYGAALILCAGAFFGWVGMAWIADDALAFLTQARVLLLDAAAFAGILGGLVFFDLLVRRCPWAPRASETTAVGSLAGVALASWIGLKIGRSGDQGWRDPMLLAAIGVCYLGAVPVGGLVARALEQPLAWLRTLLGRERLVPRLVPLTGWVLMAGTGVWTLAHFQLSPLSGTPRYPTLAPRPEGPGPNVVLVTVDTLRADHLGCYGYPRPTSPFLDSLAREGTVFQDATAAASWTKPATGTILTGLYPSRHGALYHGSLLSLPEGKQTLAEAFRNRGYVTAGFVANPNLKKVFAFDRGFDVYFDSPVEDTVTLACIRGTWFGQMLMELLRHQFNWNYENDITRMNQEVLAWLEKNSSQRFFLYAHYIDPHIPYDPPAHYREEFEQDHGAVLFNDRKRAVGIDLYDGEIRYTDDGLKELVETLQRLGVWKDTVFVLTSDHGEEFFEHGALGHGFSLFQEVVHVPLVMRGPGVPEGVRVQEPVQILDLAATLLSLTGEATPDFGDGHSFHDRLVDPAAPPAELLYMESEFGQDDHDHRQFVFNGLRKGSWKLVLTEKNLFYPPDRYGREALYDLARDPEERRNLFHEEAHQALVEGMLGRLRTHAQFLQDEGFRDLPPATLTPDVEANLRALGYIGGE